MNLKKKSLEHKINVHNMCNTTLPMDFVQNLYATTGDTLTSESTIISFLNWRVYIKINKHMHTDCMYCMSSVYKKIKLQNSLFFLMSCRL